MRFLDLDLDFFLNENAYCSESDGGRLGSEYKPWSIIRVRRFLEKRCNLSHDSPVPGCTLETHDSVIELWHRLVESGHLKAPFDVVHIDAHPDLTIRGGLHEVAGLLYIDSKPEIGSPDREKFHAGSYLTFAIASGWISSILWIPLCKTVKDLLTWAGIARLGIQQKKRKREELSSGIRKGGVPFSIISWNKFKTKNAFDYMALSRSPDFTPPESDALIPVIEWYMRKV